MRTGLQRTRCVLRRPWLVLAYLVAAFALGATVTALRLARLLA